MNKVNPELVTELTLLADEVDDLIEDMFLTVKISASASTELLLASMALRCINFFRGVRCLHREELVAPTAACLRSLVEQQWVVLAVANEASRGEAINRLQAREEFDRARAIKNLRNMRGERDERITEDMMSEVESGLGPGQNHQHKQWAELAQCGVDYLGAYAVLCNQTHPSLSALDGHMKFAESGELVGLSLQPDSEQLNLYLVDAVCRMLVVIDRCTDTWSSDLVCARTNELSRRVEALYERLPDFMASAH